MRGPSRRLPGGGALRAAAVPLALAAGVILASARVLAQLAPSTPPSAATVLFGGDVVPHQALLEAFQRSGGAAQWQPLAPLLRAAELSLANLETPVAPERPTTREQLHFNAHPDFAQALRDAGFDAVSVANNHGYDQGYPGVASTVRALRTLGLRPAGMTLPGEDPFAPLELPLAGRTLCLFAATRLLNFDIPAPRPEQARMTLARPRERGEEQHLLDAIRTHRPRCGAVLVSLHTGTEYQDHPEPADRTFFPRVAEAGADVVVGHHPHVPHPVQEHRTADGRVVPLFYSLGNLLSNQGAAVEAGRNYDPAHPNVNDDPRTREGLLAVLRFAPAGATGLHLERWGYVPVWTVRNRDAQGHLVLRAALMPRDGAGPRLVADRWTALLPRVGASFLAPLDLLPAGAESYAATAEVLPTPARRRR